MTQTTPPTQTSPPDPDPDFSRVVVDQPIYRFRNMKMCHMMSKDLEALHAMARRIGLKPEWFQNKPGGTPHYDVAMSKRALAITYGAVVVGRREIHEIIKHFKPPPSPAKLRRMAKNRERRRRQKMEKRRREAQERLRISKCCVGNVVPWDCHCTFGPPSCSSCHLKWECEKCGALFEEKPE